MPLGRAPSNARVLPERGDHSAFGVVVHRVENNGRPDIALGYSKAAGPDGDEVVRVLTEAFEGLDQGDERWLPTVARLGTLHAMRYIVGLDEADARQVRKYCTLVLSSPKGTESDWAMAHLLLGQIGLFGPELVRLFSGAGKDIAGCGVFNVNFLNVAMGLMNTPDQVGRSDRIDEPHG